VRYISSVVTQHIKSDALLQLVTFGYMFRLLHAIIRPTRNSVCIYIYIYIYVSIKFDFKFNITLTINIDFPKLK